MSKKVFFFIGTLSTGGAERVVSNLSINLNSDIKKEIIVYDDNSKIDYPFNGNIVYLDKNQHSHRLHKVKVVIRRIKELSKIKRLNPHSTIISFLEHPNLINSITAKKGKSIVSVRNHMSTKHSKGLKAKLWNGTIKYLYKRADQIISVSKEIKKDLVMNYKIDADKIRVIYNSYPLEEIKRLSLVEVEEENKKIFDNPVIITAGRLNKQKGHWHLIRAFKKVKEHVPNAKLVFLGKGNLEGYLKLLVNELDIKDDVYFLGFQKNPFKYIAKAKVFVMSSFHEGFPNALAEAMACGIPVISSDCLSGPREILAPDEFDKKEIKYDLSQKRYGVLVPVCDGVQYGAKDLLKNEEKIMADQMIRLLQDENMRQHFSKQSLARIQDFDIKNIIKEWQSII